MVVAQSQNAGQGHEANLCVTITILSIAMVLEPLTIVVHAILIL